MNAPMSGAERQRNWRDRNGANVGGPPGPPPSAPCGTVGAWRRHYRKGEDIDDPCRLAYNAAARTRRAARTKGKTS